MLRKIEPFGPPPTAEALRGLEDRLGAPLPPSYRAFLQRYNGGVPEPAFYPLEGMENNPVGDVQLLFGLETGEDSDDLRWYVEEIISDMPAGLLPIGVTNTGNLICIWIAGERVGEVYLWQSYAESEPVEWSRCGYSKLYFIADDFDAFLASLHDYDALGEYRRRTTSS
jgi:hypothetical protein